VWMTNDTDVRAVVIEVMRLQVGMQERVVGIEGALVYMQGLF
jgi:hypothetical protein